VTPTSWRVICATRNTAKATTSFTRATSHEIRTQKHKTLLCALLLFHIELRSSTQQACVRKSRSTRQRSNAHLQVLSHLGVGGLNSRRSGGVQNRQRGGAHGAAHKKPWRIAALPLKSAWTYRAPRDSFCKSKRQTCKLPQTKTRGHTTHSSCSCSTVGQHCTWKRNPHDHLSQARDQSVCNTRWGNYVRKNEIPALSCFSTAQSDVQCTGNLTSAGGVDMCHTLGVCVIDTPPLAAPSPRVDELSQYARCRQHICLRMT